MADLQIALYVSSVTGHHVTRHGTGTLIGAEIDLQHPGNIRWDEDKIVAIPEAEYQAYQIEYTRLIEQGALKKRGKDEYDHYVAETSRAIDEAASKAADAAKKAATAAEGQ